MVGRCQEIGFRIIGVPDRNFYGFGLDKPVLIVGHGAQYAGIVAFGQGPVAFARQKNIVQVGLGIRIIGPGFKRVKLGKSRRRQNRNNGDNYQNFYQGVTVLVFHSSRTGKSL